MEFWKKKTNEFYQEDGKRGFFLHVLQVTDTNIDWIEKHNFNLFKISSVTIVASQTVKYTWIISNTKQWILKYILHIVHTAQGILS